MYCALVARGVRVPNGFATDAQAYRDMLDDAGVWSDLHDLLDDVDKTDTGDLASRAQKAREIVYGIGLSTTLCNGFASIPFATRRIWCWAKSGRT